MFTNLNISQVVESGFCPVPAIPYQFASKLEIKRPEISDEPRRRLVIPPSRWVSVFEIVALLALAGSLLAFFLYFLLIIRNGMPVE